MIEALRPQLGNFSYKATKGGYLLTTEDNIKYFLSSSGVLTLVK